MKNWSDRMTRVLLTGSFAVLVGSVGIPMANASTDSKVTICHVPPGNPSNIQLITVGAPAVPAHVANHGDAVCAAGDSDCCADPSGAVCTNLQDDADNCGTCGNACPTGDSCVAGVCTSTCQPLPPCGDTCDGVCVENQQACCGGPIQNACSPFNCSPVGATCGFAAQCCNGNCVDGCCIAIP
jgi:hypothetical protein